MQTYEHKNVTITFDDTSAVFSANLKGEWVTTVSLLSMKKKIDKALEVLFEPFDALRAGGGYYHSGNEPVAPIRVTGLRRHKSRRRWEKDYFYFEVEGTNGRQEASGGKGDDGWIPT